MIINTTTAGLKSIVKTAKRTSSTAITFSEIPAEPYAWAMHLQSVSDDTDIPTSYQMFSITRSTPTGAFFVVHARTISSQSVGKYGAVSFDPTDAGGGTTYNPSTQQFTISLGSTARGSLVASKTYRLIAFY